jgi:hypothetical protein
MALGVWGLATLLSRRLIGLGARVVVGELDADFSSIFALADQAVPVVGLAAAVCNYSVEVDPGLANQLCLLVVVEDGHLEAVVVGRVVDGEAQLLVPSRRLAAALVGGSLLSLLAEAGGAVGVLLAHGALVGQVAGAVDDGDEGADDGPVDGHVGEDAGGVGGAEGGHVEFGRHEAGWGARSGEGERATAVEVEAEAEVEREAARERMRSSQWRSVGMVWCGRRRVVVEREFMVGKRATGSGDGAWGREQQVGRGRGRV